LNSSLTSQFLRLKRDGSPPFHPAWLSSIYKISENDRKLRQIGLAVIMKIPLQPVKQNNDKRSTEYCGHMPSIYYTMYKQYQL
jgi:polysaccharide deacetylase 2 family uncharacterized protein YibQ